MNKTFHAGFELYESAEGSGANDFGFNDGVNGIFFGNQAPGIGNQLFETEGDLLVFFIYVQYIDIDFIADVEDFGGMVHSVPSHLRNMKQTVYAIEIDESTEVGDSLNGTAANLIFFDFIPGFGSFGGFFFFQECFSGEDQFVVVFIAFKNFEFDGLVFVFVQLAYEAHFHEGSGNKAFEADIHKETAFNDVKYFAFEDFTGIHGSGQFFPCEVHIYSLFGEERMTVFVFSSENDHFHRIAFMEQFGDVFRFAGGQFVSGDDPFAFGADVNHQFAVGNFNNGTGQSFTTAYDRNIFAVSCVRCCHGFFFFDYFFGCGSHRFLLHFTFRGFCGFDFIQNFLFHYRVLLRFFKNLLDDPIGSRCAGSNAYSFRIFKYKFMNI